MLVEEFYEKNTKRLDKIYSNSEIKYFFVENCIIWTRI